MTESVIRQAEVAPAMAGMRLDQACSRLFPEFSRSCLQNWIRAGALRVDGQKRRPRDPVNGGERVEIEAVLTPSRRVEAQDLPLRVIHEDDELLVIDKPVGLVVHPAAGNPDGTLQNALLHHAPELAALPRGGIVHRLDKDTSGLMVVARTLAAHKSLVDQLRERSIQREYQALVHGSFSAGGKVDAPIGRHPRDRKRMAVVTGGKPARTHYRIARRFAAHTLLNVRLETGRTHQIRVHLAHIHHPLVGDPVYGGRPRLPKGCGPDLRAALQAFPRQALHALRLGLRHPRSSQSMQWSSPLPNDFQALLRQLEEEEA